MVYEILPVDLPSQFRSYRDDSPILDIGWGVGGDPPAKKTGSFIFGRDFGALCMPLHLHVLLHHITNILPEYSPLVLDRHCIDNGRESFVFRRPHAVEPTT